MDDERSYPFRTTICSTKMREIQRNHAGSNFGVSGGRRLQNSWAQGIERHQIICLGDISGRFPVGQDFGRQIEFDLEHPVVSGETDTALSVVKTTSFVWKGDAHQRPPSSCQRSPVLLFGWGSGLARVDDCFWLARELRRADLALTPLRDMAETMGEASRFMSELAFD